MRLSSHPFDHSRKTSRLSWTDLCSLPSLPYNLNTLPRLPWPALNAKTNLQTTTPILPPSRPQHSEPKSPTPSQDSRAESDFPGKSYLPSSSFSSSSSSSSSNITKSAEMDIETDLNCNPLNTQNQDTEYTRSIPPPANQHKFRPQYLLPTPLLTSIKQKLRHLHQFSYPSVICANRFLIFTTTLTYALRVSLPINLYIQNPVLYCKIQKIT